MVLTTHIVFGSVGAQLMTSNPYLGFLAGFVSHFILDAVPHWDYTLKSRAYNPKNRLDVDMKIGSNFVRDLFLIGLDFCLGFTIAITYFYLTATPFGLVALLGGIGAVFPDFLQFVYFKFKTGPLLSLQRFHVWIHSKISLNNRPTLGIISQAVLIIALLLIVN